MNLILQNNVITQTASGGLTELSSC